MHLVALSLSATSARLGLRWGFEPLSFPVCVHWREVDETIQPQACCDLQHNALITYAIHWANGLFQ